MKKSAWKNIIPSLSYDFLKIRICLSIQHAQNLQIAILKIHQRYINFDTKDASDLKFGMYLPCVAFHKFDAAILKILLFGQKVAAILDFWQFFAMCAV